MACRPPRFARIVLDADMPGGYQVEVADVNGDKKPDIVALGNGTCAWYENPSWKKRIITTPKQTPGIISTATADLDGDGKAEVAIGYEFEMNEPKKGKLLLAIQGKTADNSWTLKPIAEIGSIHRLRWGELDGDFTHPELVVAPLFGPEAKPPRYDDPARVAVFRVGPTPKEGNWQFVNMGFKAARPVLHAIDVGKSNRERTLRSRVLTADNLGVGRALIRPDFTGWLFGPSLVLGAPGDAPKRGCSEVHVGRTADDRAFLATVEPWHGSEVAIYRARFPVTNDESELDHEKFAGFGPRLVIDDTLSDGHALWVADVDGDGDDEVFAGHRGKDHRVSMYDFDGKTWVKTVLDRDIAAQDLRGGDIDGDGTPDVVAIGGSTHNVVWYRPRK